MPGGGKNPFYDPDEEIDDEEFLRQSKPANSSGYLGYSGNASGSAPNSRPMGNTYEDRQQSLVQKRREIEQRTLDSSQRSLGLLHESEKVGQATAEELARQKEQLKATEGRLDDINSTLNRSERHLQGIKSVFGGIRNYFAGRGAAQPAGVAGGSAGAIQQPSSTGSSSAGGAVPDSGPSDPLRHSQHPGLRSRGLGDDAGAGLDGLDSVDDRLNKNLDDMGLGLGRLKAMAQDLNQELGDHNDLIDRLDHKTSNTNWRVEKQNKDMNKLLKK